MSTEHQNYGNGYYFEITADADKIEEWYKLASKGFKGYVDESDRPKIKLIVWSGIPDDIPPFGGG